jgi:hypothetical protein
MDQDLAFDPMEGSLERIGPTRRVGAAAHAVTRAGDWLVGSLSVTYVHASLLDAPPPTAEDPAPPFSPGELLPYVAPLTIRLDARAVQPVVQLGRHSLEVEVKSGFTYLSKRPLPYGQWSPQLGLLDAGLALLWGPLDLGVSGFNLLDIAYENQAFHYVSNWDPSAPPSRLPARHLAAGRPISLLVHLGVSL